MRASVRVEDSTASERADLAASQPSHSITQSLNLPITQSLTVLLLIVPLFRYETTNGDSLTNDDDDDDDDGDDDDDDDNSIERSCCDTSGGNCG